MNVANTKGHDMDEMRVERVDWTKEDFEGFLARRHPGQRRLQTDRIDRIADAALKGEWWWPHSPLTVGYPSGYSLDGHNRAAGLVKALSQMPPGTALPVLLAHLPDRAVPNLGDVGARTIPQDLKYRFPDGKNLSAIAALLPLCMSLEQTGQVKIHGRPFARPAMMDYAERHYDRLSDVVVFAHRIAAMDSQAGRDGKNREGIVTTRTLGIVLWDSWDEPGVEEFWIGYGSGSIPVNARDPRAEMVSYFRDKTNRYKLGRGSASRFQVAWAIASLAEAWNAHSQGRVWTPWDEKDQSFGIPLATSCRGKDAA